VKNPQLKEVNLTLNFSYDNELFELKELYYINNSSKIIILKNNTINSFTLQKQEKIDFFSTLSTKKIQLKHKAKNHEIEISTIFKDKKSSSDTLEVYVVN
jgi:hypothetical protein